MSIQAVAWALEQDLPARPKLVLVSIANHADHRTGYCWLKAETIAGEAACTPRAVYNFVGDLIRNGFIRKALRKGDDGKQRATDYWILFERTDAPWLKDRQPGEDDADADATTDSVPHEHGASGETENEPGSEVVDIPAGSSGPHEHACIRKESIDEPSKTKPEKSEPGSPLAAALRSYKPPPIAPEPQGATHTQTNERIFVIAGTRAWDAWMHYRRTVQRKPGCHTYRKFVEGVGWREGWDFPSLFPPAAETGKESAEGSKATGPPSQKTA
jgi:hypothetical protein